MDDLDDLCTRRSRTREEVLLVADEMGIATLARLAERAGIRPNLVRMAIHGREPYFRVDLSLVARGYLVRVERPRGAAFEITMLGRRRAAGIRATRRRMAARMLACRPAAREEPPGGRKRG